MRILLIDPGLTGRWGHNLAMLEEFDTELRDRPGVSLVCAGAATLDKSAFAHLACDVRPAFRVQGYSRFAPSLPADVFSDVARMCVQDLSGLNPGRFDLVLMPTAYPAHLLALSALAKDWSRTHVACGLMLPPSFWSLGGAAPWLDLATQQAIGALSSFPNVFLYSETDRYRIGATTIRVSGVMLPPASGRSLRRMAEHAARPWPATGETGPLRFGFFGIPTAQKGFDHLVTLAREGLPADRQLVLRLIAGQEKLCAELNAGSDRVDARSAVMNNLEFLDAMASVDVVVAHYEPAVYQSQASGIVGEAICLGKPVLIANGCDSLDEYLSRYAPNSCVRRPFGIDGLREAIRIPAKTWRRHAAAAAASSEHLRSAKDLRRYLAVTSGGRFVLS